MKHVENSEGQKIFLRSNKFNKKEAVAGACLVFSLTDVVERLFSSLFENGKSGLGIIFLVKLWASRHLITCIKSLIQPNIVEDVNVLLVDLHSRLERWQCQGQEI
ncbi:hypothetical protein P3X46_019539 [Hevea brasiliensis]|uniref:Uncharacterized protein n=1 Tax=Hevea brasiliensis TaxID=3981 RepID=A0ABQ9LL06_HEVBR|nr:hypothetical protein P3X46_019539 [Hevea brasiliensis]